MAANMHNDYADRKNGRKPIVYEHPDLEGVLGDTQGLMIYQESLMRVAQKFAGYTLEEADDLRRACAKKKRELMAKERARFEESVERNGYSREIGKKLFDVIEPFADYAFPKSHAYCYGYIAYQTAWLKAHYPVEYFAALLTSVKDDKDKTAVYLAECRAMGVEVQVPDINVSESDFSARGNTIPFGLSAIRNVGSGLVGHIVAERDANGPFTDFYASRSSTACSSGAGASPRASTTCSARPPRSHSTTPGCRSPTSSSTRCRGSRSRRRCSVFTSPTTRCSAPSGRSGNTPKPQSPRLEKNVKAKWRLSPASSPG
jgi:DNA polymerase III alpha subunit